jgi:hypothetical protein
MHPFDRLVDESFVWILGQQPAYGSLSAEGAAHLSLVHAKVYAMMWQYQRLPHAEKILIHTSERSIEYRV